MGTKILIAGGGIGGMAAALACSRAGYQVQVRERAAVFTKVGAGVQAGPNVTRLLQRWGLQQALDVVAARPARLEARDAQSGRNIGNLRLGADMQQRYGAPYMTVHRADLHALLHTAAQRSGVQLQLNDRLQDFLQSAQAVTALSSADAQPHTVDALVGADGLWSGVRHWLLADGPPQPTGHRAYRALLRQADLPEALRSQQVTVWLGPDLHVVQYPVRHGDWLNVVVVIGGPMASQPEADAWNHRADMASLRQRLAGVCTPLLDLVQAIDSWSFWVLHDRPALQNAGQMARGRVALLGDAAHPMRPYLAQGAGMAIEDAAALGAALAQTKDIPAAFAHYATQRWQRNARVQARSQRNGRIFHATGLLRWGRNRAMQLSGGRVMDLPWLYRST